MKKKFLGILVCTLLIITAVMPLVVSDATIDQEQTKHDNEYSTYSNNWIAQSFKPTMENLSSIELFVGKKGNPTTDLIVSIRSLITGADLAEVTKSAGELTSALDWFEFDFDDLNVTPEDTYYIILRTSGGNNFNAYQWGFGYYNPYNRGSFWKSSNSGSSWAEYTYYDFCFKTHGEPSSPQVPVLSYSPSSYDFGNMMEGVTDSTSFEIWNSGTGTLTYTLTETCSWITSILPSSGTSTGEYDTIIINIDTTGLSTGSYSFDVIINSNGGNNVFTASLTVNPGPILTFNPISYDFGNMMQGVTDSTSFEIWNSGTGTLTYSLSETCGWISLSSYSGDSIGEHDVITVNIDTTGLSVGNYSCDISISSNGGSGLFTVYVDVVGCTPDCHSLDAADGNPIDALYVNDYGNVGIGTNNPNAKLDVDGNILISNKDKGLILWDGWLNRFALKTDSFSETNSVLKIGNGFHNVCTSPSANVGIGTTSPDAKLHVEDGAVLFNGDTGGTPTSGSGIRLMWIPSKGAFRVGVVNGNDWDDINIGTNSVAMGYDTIASGVLSTAMGYDTEASGDISTAMGHTITVSGGRSVGIGLDDTSYTVSDNNVMSIMGGNVGIGTTSPDATLEVSGTMKVLGEWDEGVEFDTVYKAQTDGFVIAYIRAEYEAGGFLNGYTDDTNTLLFEKTCASAYDSGTDCDSLFMPVRKGDYWKVIEATYGFVFTYISWIPLGT